MALQVPQHLNGRSPEYLYNVMKATYRRESQYGDSGYVPVCSDRPYEMKVCHSAERSGIRYGHFRSTNFACQWLGVGCTSGNFYSKMVVHGQSTYELRVGQFTMGRLGGRYAVAALDVNDTRFIGQCVDNWGGVKGDQLILGAALASACNPAVEPFTRVVQALPDGAAIRRTRAEVVTSSTTIESGMRTYCKNVAVPPYNSNPSILPRRANWWIELRDSVASYLHPMRDFLQSDEMASID